MEWFSKHYPWLITESLELSNNSVYKETYQFIDKTFISTGDIIVHKEETSYYPILIVYSESTPYTPPIIYILKDPLSKDIAMKYSTLSPEDIRKEVIRNVRLFNRRHQNSDGSICFIETGDFHNESAEFYPIKYIIKRLRLWLSGIVPKDSAEVELFSHFRNRHEKMEYLLPEIFYDTEIVKGTFYASLPPLMPLNDPSNLYINTFMGCLIIGENDKGVAILPKIYINNLLVLFSKIPDPLILLKTPRDQTIQNDIDMGKIIEGYWWDISQEPEPFSEVTILATYIGNGNQEKGIDELVTVLEIPLKRMNNYIHLGIRFPGRRKKKDWQMFGLKKGNRPPILIKDKQELIERLKNYSIEAIRQEDFTEAYYHMRNEGRANRSVLKSIKLSIIGCGALGSEISDCLCKAGIGTLLLIDKENLKTHNSIRHCLGINRVNFPKVLALLEYLLLHNPFINIIQKPLNILQTDINELLPNEYIGISTIADDNIEAFLNEKALDKNKPMFYARALRGGKTGRIFRVIPGKDACKNCLSLYKRDKNPCFIDIEEDPELPIITNECNNPIRPASAADIKIIASLAARIIIEYLQNKINDHNHWIWATEPLRGLDIDVKNTCLVRSSFIPPHPSCPICQKLESKIVSITKEAYELMKLETTTSKDVEIGGILIGHIKENGEYMVINATGPGPQAIRTASSFLKDNKYCQAEIEKAFKTMGNKGIYLGEWHYHPKGTNKPSGLDIKSLTEIAKQDNYRIDKPLLIIFSPSLECAITIHDKNGCCVEIPLNVIEKDTCQIDLPPLVIPS